MTRERIEKLVLAYGFVGEDAEYVTRLCCDVERETRHEYFSLIQNANNAASSQEITARELDKFVWDKSQEKRKC